MTSSPLDLSETVSLRKKCFQMLFAELPFDANHRLEALAEINGAFRQALLDQLQPVIRVLLQESPPKNGDETIQLAKQLNRVLRDANLAIVDPDSGGRQPASVSADPGRFRLQSRHLATGRQTASRNVKKLPPLELMEHVREEPIRTWRERDDRDHASRKATR